MDFHCRLGDVSSWMQVIEAQDSLPVAGVVTLYASLLTFTLQVHPDRLDYVDQILVSLSIVYSDIPKYESKCISVS